MDSTLYFSHTRRLHVRVDVDVHVCILWIIIMYVTSSAHYARLDLHGCRRAESFVHEAQRRERRCR